MLDVDVKTLYDVLEISLPQSADHALAVNKEDGGADELTDVGVFLLFERIFSHHG
ncbi:MAG: hypothetical protein QS721_01350 [Candidatus Endonucleobacter sp. (ex Gigantidas childressi)]|nr:hypothetical protein [Candidatus Endonucleobacter sp. (ex Gigantidas childressi)]